MSGARSRARCRVCGPTLRTAWSKPYAACRTQDVLPEQRPRPAALSRPASRGSPGLRLPRTQSVGRGTGEHTGDSECEMDRARKTDRHGERSRNAHLRPPPPRSAPSSRASPRRSCPPAAPWPSPPPPRRATGPCTPCLRAGPGGGARARHRSGPRAHEDGRARNHPDQALWPSPPLRRRTERALAQHLIQLDVVLVGHASAQVAAGRITSQVPGLVQKRATSAKAAHCSGPHISAVLAALRHWPPSTS